jgi:hypothetical protein
MSAKKIQGFANDKTILIDNIIASLETTVSKAQEKMYRRLLDDVINKLDLGNGRIKNTQKNKRLLNAIDATFKAFNTDTSIKIVNEVVTAIDKVISFNNTYFEQTAESKLNNIEPVVRAQMNEWLGIEKGTLKQNGYFDKIIQDSTIKNKVKDLILKNVVTQSGFESTRNQMSDFINGAGNDGGQLQKYYRNMVYDTISVTDRIVGFEYANANGYEFAVYEGGLIKTSREFCIKRNGKVFHKSEIELFNPTVARPPNYNPFIDLGGYACRHHLNWVSRRTAQYFRPEIENMFL